MARIKNVINSKEEMNISKERFGDLVGFFRKKIKRG